MLFAGALCRREPRLLLLVCTSSQVLVDTGHCPRLLRVPTAMPNLLALHTSLDIETKEVTSGQQRPHTDCRQLSGWVSD